MNAKKLGFRGIIVVVAVGCGCSGESTDQLGTSQDLKHVRLDDLNDLHPVIREQIDRIEATAHRLAGPDWHHLDWHERWHPPASSSRRIARTDYRTLWCARSSDPSHFFSRSTEPPYHCITLCVSRHQEDLKILRDDS